MAFESPQGVDFKFNNKSFKATSISISASAGEQDVTAVNDTVGTHPYGRFEPSVMKNADVSVEWFGAEAPDMDKAYALALGGATASVITASQISAVCTTCQITAQAGELLKGTATFKITHD